MTTCSSLHSYHVSEKIALISSLKMERVSTPEMLVPMYFARLRGVILGTKMFLHFIRTLARKVYVILWGDKRYLKLKTNNYTLIWVLKVQKRYRALKYVTVYWFSASVFRYYVPACTENVHIKLTLLLVIVQELTLRSRRFLCKFRIVQLPKKLVAYYATRKII